MMMLVQAKLSVNFSSERNLTNIESKARLYALFFFYPPFSKFLISHHILPGHVLVQKASCWLLYYRDSLCRSCHPRPPNDKLNLPSTLDRKRHSHDGLTAASTPSVTSTRLFLIGVDQKALEAAIATTLHRSG